MFSVDDMRSCIEEWFESALNLVEVAKTYHEVVSEAERQLECMTAEALKEDGK